MQFSKYIFALALSAILAEATEHSSISTGKKPLKQTASKASTVIQSHEIPKAILEHDDYNHGYGDKDYDSTKTTHRYENNDYNRTTTHRYKYGDHDTTKTAHGNTLSFLTETL